MDFQTLARRELQALCKLNKIPANITNVAMIDALSSLGVVVGIEDFLNPSETTESSVETPAKTAIMSPRVPRTGYRTTTRQKPVREEAEAVTTVTRTTRRGVRKIAGEVEDSKTAAVPVTPAAVSTRRRAPAASARKNMETQMKESKEDEKVDEPKDQEKKSVPVTPAAAVPSSRRKAPAASTTRGANVKEESMFGRTYSTRRSARLAEVKVAEPTPVEKESKKLEKIDSVSTQSFEEMLDEGSDDLNAVAEDSSLSGSSEVNSLAVGIESKSELIMELEKEKTSSADTDMGTEDTMAVDAKNDVLESMGSNNMEVDVIPSDIQNPSEDSKCETVEKLSSNEHMDSVDVAAAEMDNEVLDNKVGDVYPSATENSSETLKDESDEESCEESDTNNSSETLEDESDEESCEESDSENSSETLKQENVENVFTSEDMDSDEKTASLVESVVLENKVENLNELEEISFSFAEEEPLVDDVKSEDLEKKESAELKSSESDVESQNLEKSDSAAQDEFQDDFEFPQLVSQESVDESVVMDTAADFSSFSLTSIPSSDADAVPTQVPSSKTTPLKKSAAKTPSRKMPLVSDDKENIDQSGTKLQLIKDVGMTIKKDNDQSKALFEEKSLRQLTKMLKEKLQISNNVNTNAEETNTTNKVQQTTRPALQALSSNSLASTGMGN